MARPKKQETQNSRATIRMTEAEAAELLRKAEAEHLSVNAYIRARVIEKPTGRPSRPRQRKAAADVAALAACLAQLGKIGSNLNQIAHHLNGGFAGAAELATNLRAELDALRPLRAAIVQAIEGRGNSERSREA